LKFCGYFKHACLPAYLYTANSFIAWFS
jgi:hypothetical protein